LIIKYCNLNTNNTTKISVTFFVQLLVFSLPSSYFIWYRPGICFGAVSVSEPPICIFITRELVTRMTSEAYVYIVDTVDSSPYKAMSRQLSVNVSILYVIKHL